MAKLSRGSDALQPEVSPDCWFRKVPTGSLPSHAMLPSREVGMSQDLIYDNDMFHGRRVSLPIFEASRLRPRSWRCGGQLLLFSTGAVGETGENENLLLPMVRKSR